MALELRIAIELVLFALLVASVWWGYRNVRKALHGGHAAPSLPDPDEDSFRVLLDQHEKIRSMRQDK